MDESSTRHRSALSIGWKVFWPSEPLADVQNRTMKRMWRRRALYHETRLQLFLDWRIPSDSFQGSRRNVLQLRILFYSFQKKFAKIVQNANPPFEHQRSKNEGTKQAAMCPLMGVFQIDLSLSNLNLMICHQLLTAHGSNPANPVRGNMKMRAKYHTIRRLNINTKCMKNTNRLKRPSPTRRDMQNGSVDLQ